MNRSVLGVVAALLVLSVKSNAVTQTVIDLAIRDSMTAISRKVFYLNNPKITSDREFLNNTCGEHEPHAKETSPLGCYLSVDRGIFIYNISDPRLSGTMETVAAHEMLHAFYIRLSADEKKRFDSLSEQFFKTITNQDILERIKLYPEAQRNAELHSVLGTEVSRLPRELEAYYAQYFSERSRVVAFSARSRTAVLSQIEKVNASDRRLTLLKKSIEQETTHLSLKAKKISTLRSDLNGNELKQNVAEYNRRTADMNIQIRDYNRLVRSYDALVKQYNGLAAERNALASVVQRLVEELDTRNLPKKIKK